MKKYLNIFILILLSIILNGCTMIPGENQFLLPSLEGKTREQIDYVLKDYDLEYVYYIDHEQYHPNYDQFIRYGNGLKAGSIVDKGSFVRIYTTPLKLTYRISQNIKLDVDYTGKSFCEDGIGEVKLVRTTDGDTARFRDVVTGEEFNLRFLGIDTPESTWQKDPWGKAASDYAKERLTSAKHIVLERENTHACNMIEKFGAIDVSNLDGFTKYILPINTK